MTTTSTTVAIPTTNRPKRDGSRIECPAPEGMVLRTEADMSLSHGSFKRVLDSFIFLVKGKPSSLTPEILSSQKLRDVQVIGAVASLVGKDSLLAQCGWFNQITWRWMHLPVITGIYVTTDDLYRGGATCMLLTTPMGRYTIFSPHKRYAPLWDQSVTFYGSEAAAAFRFERHAHDSPAPTWWDKAAQWPPSAEGQGTKRPPPTNVQELEALTIEDNDTEGNPDATVRRVRRRESPPTPTQAIKPLSTSSSKMKPWDLVKNRCPDQSTGNVLGKSTLRLAVAGPSIPRPHST